jgi:hypothetical protein
MDKNEPWSPATRPRALAVSQPSGRAKPKPDSRSAASARGSGAMVRISRAIGMVKCRMLMVVWHDHAERGEDHQKKPMWHASRSATPPE